MKTLTIFILLLASMANSQEVRTKWNSEEQEYFTRIRKTLEKAIPRLSGFSSQDHIFERNIAPTALGIDTAIPMACSYHIPFIVDTTYSLSTKGNFVNFYIYVNPNPEIGHTQQKLIFSKASLETSNGVNVEKKFWGSFEEIESGGSIMYSPKYNPDHRYLQVQSIYLMVIGDKANTSKILQNIDSDLIASLLNL